MFSPIVGCNIEHPHQSSAQNVCIPAWPLFCFLGQVENGEHQLSSGNPAALADAAVATLATPEL